MSGETVILEGGPGEIRGALLRDGAVWDVELHRANAPQRVGALYRGRVRRIDPAINGAFVDIGIGQDGFLRARDAVLVDGEGGAEAGGRRNAQIAQVLHEGQRVVVRVVADAFADKGPRLAAEPGDTAGEPACLEPSPSPVVHILERFADPERTDAIVCGDGALARAARSWAESFFPDLAGRVERDSGSPFRDHGVDEAIEQALGRRVALPGGAELVFDMAESLCAIDVNAGGQSGKASRAARDVNLRAVREIARQLRLRNIAGAIVIDALRMGARDDRNRVLDALRSALRGDSSTCHVLGVSALGLIEMTRTRTGPGLAERLCDPLGDPRLRADAVAYAALRAAVSQGVGSGSAGAGLRVSGEVAALLDGALRPARDEAAAQLGRLDVTGEAGWPRTRFEVVLGSAPSPGREGARRSGPSRGGFAGAPRGGAGGSDRAGGDRPGGAHRGGGGQRGEGGRR